MGANTSDREDVQAVLDAVRRLVQHLHESSREAEQRLGLTGAQLFVLRRLADAGPLSVNELAACTFTHQSSVSTVVARLGARRLVTAQVDPDDARRRILKLTTAGRRALAAAPHSAQEGLIDAIGRLAPATRRTVASALNRMAGRVATNRRPGMFFEARPGDE